jgi:DNA repair exonuclease SbcCD ATPase subunit
VKIDSIELSWFRGAGEKGTLETDLKNVVIYGANGSGKSSFVDALEYIISNGRIRHLAHEYSGRKQEKGIINTHIPDEASASVKISFPNECSVQATINKYGDCSFSCNPQGLLHVIQSWQLEKLVLRQDEVANFINSTKGEKYSALIPLLGLEDYEMAAQNTNGFVRCIKDEGTIDNKEGRVQILQNEITKHFPDPTEENIYEKLKGIAADYEVKEIPQNLCELANLLNSAIQKKIELSEPDIKRHSLIHSIDEEDCKIN